MIHARNYKTFGPYGLRPHGQPRKATRYHVVDAAGRKITPPINHTDALRLSALLNEVLEQGLMLGTRLKVYGE